MLLFSRRPTLQGSMRAQCAKAHSLRFIHMYTHTLSSARRHECMPAVSNTYHKAYSRSLAQVQVFGGTCNLLVSICVDISAGQACALAAALNSAEKSFYGRCCNTSSRRFSSCPLITSLGCSMDGAATVLLESMHGNSPRAVRGRIVRRLPAFFKC